MFSFNDYEESERRVCGKNVRAAEFLKREDELVDKIRLPEDLVLGISFKNSGSLSVVDVGSFLLVFTLCKAMQNFVGH